MFGMKTMTIVLAATGAIVLGGCAGDPTESAEYVQVTAELETARADLTVAQDELKDTLDDLPDREAKLERDLLALDEKRLDLEEVADDLMALTKQLAKREKAVGIAEKIAAANTISGEGVYRVGQDMTPGTYRSVDNHDCYWMLSSDANGSDIIENAIVTGPALASVAAGQFFTTNRCGDWVKQ